MLSVKTKIKETAQDALIIGVSLAVLVLISYDSFIRKRNRSYHRPIDF